MGGICKRQSRPRGRWKETEGRGKNRGMEGKIVHQTEKIAGSHCGCLADECRDAAKQERESHLAELRAAQTHAELSRV